MSVGSRGCLGGLGAPLTRPEAGLPVLLPSGRDFLLFFFPREVGLHWPPAEVGRSLSGGGRPQTFTPPPATECILDFLLPWRWAGGGGTSSLTGSRRRVFGGLFLFPHLLRGQSLYLSLPVLWETGLTSFSSLLILKLLHLRGGGLPFLSSLEDAGPSPETEGAGDSPGPGYSPPGQQTHEGSQALAGRSV